MRKPITEAFGRVLREVRMQREMSLNDLSVKSGVHRDYILRVEQGRSTPTLNIMESLCTGLGMPVSELMQKAEGR